MSAFANSDAILTLSEDAVGVAAPRIGIGLVGPAVSVGWHLFSARLLCILCAICCSNDLASSTFMGLVKGGIGPEKCLIGCEKGGKKSEVEM